MHQEAAALWRLLHDNDYNYDFSFGLETGFSDWFFGFLDGVFAFDFS